MILDPTDQRIRDQGFNFVPFDRYLASPFQIPQNQGTGEARVSAGLPTIYQQAQGGGGGEDNDPFNANMNQIRTDFKPNTDFRQFQDFGNFTDAQLTTAQRKEMDMYPEYYGINTGVPRKGIAGFMDKAIGFLPGVGMLSRVGPVIQNMLPVNQRAILENQARGAGILTDDIGRVVSGSLNYNTPEGVMAGYNLGKITQETIDKRTDRIGQTLGEKYGISDADIQGLMDGTIDDDDISAKYGITTNLTSQIRNVVLGGKKIIGAQTRAKQIADFKKAQKIQEKLQKEQAKAEAARQAAFDQARSDRDRAVSSGLDAAIREGRDTSGFDRSDSGAYAEGAGMGAGGGYASDFGFMDGGIVDLVDIYD